MRNGLEWCRAARRTALYLSVSVCVLSSVNAWAQRADTLTSPPPAQATDAADVQDIIVTAQKRSTSLQRTPLAVTALSEEALQQSQVHALDDVNSLVPALKVGSNAGYAQVTIRGIGINNFVPLAESAVALNVNDVYLSRPVAFLAGLYDISSLEVLRGPQGTLYGRNATAGAVNLTTTRPTEELSGYANLTIGNYGQVRGEAAIGGALVDDKILVRVAGFREFRDGYGTNLTTGHDIDDKNAYGVRGTIVVKPTPELTATVIGEYYREHDSGAAFHYFGGAGLSGLPGAFGAPPVFILLGGRPPSNPYDVANRIDPRFRLRTAAVTGIVEWSRGPYSVRSITGYRDQDSFSRQNIAGGDPGAYSLAGEPAHQFSQEIQGHYDSTSLHLTVGAYLFTERDDYRPATVVTDNAVLNLVVPTFIPGYVVPPGFTRTFETGGKLRINAKAVFGEVSYNVTSSLSVTAGLRYSSERKQLDNRFLVDFFTPYTMDFVDVAPVAETRLPSRTFKSTTPKFGIQYQVDPRTLLYVTYAKGFKSGGFSTGAPDTLAAISYQPEKLTDYEGGIKTTLFDHRLRLNLAGFYYDYTGLQVQQAFGTSLLIQNAASARLYGLEAEASAVVTSALTVDANASWLHARYLRYTGAGNDTPFLTSIDFSGKRLNNAPDFQGHAAANYKLQLAKGNVQVRGEAEYSSAFYFSPTNVMPIGQRAFAKGNAYVTYSSDAGWHLKAFVKNITNEATRVSAFTASALFGTPVNGALSPPRTYGVELGYQL